MAEVTAPVRRSPLAHRSPIEATDSAIHLAERSYVAKFILRADRHAAVEPLRNALGLGLPFDALTSSVSGETAFLWIGPDEWMLLAAPGDADVVRNHAAAALAGMHHQLVDVSDYYTVIEVGGPRSRELLMKLTTLDLHPRAFRPGMTTGSVFGKANATIWLAPDDAEAGATDFRLIIRWSMADYLWRLLADAGREWGVPEQTPIKGEKLTVI